MKFSASTHYVWHHLIVTIRIVWRRKEPGAVDCSCVQFCGFSQKLRSRLTQSIDAEPWHNRNPGHVSRPLQNLVLMKPQRMWNTQTQLQPLHICWRIPGHYTFEKKSEHCISGSHRRSKRLALGPTTFLQTKLIHICPLNSHTWSRRLTS